MGEEYHNSHPLAFANSIGFSFRHLMQHLVKLIIFKSTGTSDDYIADKSLCFNTGALFIIIIMVDFCPNCKRINMNVELKRLKNHSKCPRCGWNSGETNTGTRPFSKVDSETYVGKLFLMVILPSDRSQFHDYLFDHITKIIEKGYPFIKLSTMRSNLQDMMILSGGFHVSRNQFDVETTLNILDNLALESKMFRMLAIVNEDLYSRNNPGLFYIDSMYSMYSVVVSTRPLEYKYWEFLDHFFDQKVNRFAKEFEINTENLSTEDLFKIFWLSVEIFHELGHVFGLPDSSDVNDIMYPPHYQASKRNFSRVGSYKMPESGLLLNEILRKLNLKVLDESSPLFTAQDTCEKPNT
jgi:predicted Zn-dependent protease